MRKASTPIKDKTPLSSPTIGILLAQLGTPDAPTPSDVRRFLREFLSDIRVVDLPRWFWLPLLHGIILPTRSPRSAALYQKIWRSDGLSPLLYYSQAVTDALSQRLGANIQVRLAMRYGQPNLADVLGAMTREGMEKILIFPLFPQYSSAATASITDAVCATFTKSRFQPALRFAPPFFNAPGYINALVAKIRATCNPTEEMDWLFSFHGLPLRFVNEGDPYAHQCQTTAQLLANALNLPSHRWRLSYQSRFGREPWLLPNTEAVLSQLPQEKIRRIAVVCPGFLSDCLETLEEIAVRGKETFLQAGGETFIYIPCLNDAPEWIDALTNLAKQEILGWMGQE